MRLLAIDPGAERCGYAVLESGDKLITSGILRWHREEDFQVYRMSLEEVSFAYFDILFDRYEPDLAVNEIIPAVGGGNFSVATQSYLANVVVTCYHNVAFLHDVPIEQISARTVHKQVALKPKRKTKSVTKVQVRNGVLERVPELRPRLRELVADETDAIAIGLTALDIL